jgi:hypothetical protein
MTERIATRRRPSEVDYDALVTAVAASMTRPAPDLDVAPGVLARLDARRGAGLAGHRLGLAVTIATLVVAAGAIWTSRSMADAVPAVTGPGAPSLSGPAASMPGPGADAAAPAAARAAARPAAPADLGASERAWHERRIPELATPDAIPTPPIQPDAVALPLLALEPLAPTPLTLRPLDTERLRSGR